MFKKYCFSILILFLSTTVLAQFQPHQILSPDGKMMVKIALTHDRCLNYSFAYLQQPVILNSKFGIHVNGEKWEEKIVIHNIATRAVDTVWQPLYGERSSIKNQYNESVFYLNKEDNKNKQLQIIVRV